jgi:hypothetical protein
MVVILPDLPKMACSVHVVHRSLSSETVDLQLGPRRFFHEGTA